MTRIEVGGEAARKICDAAFSTPGPIELIAPDGTVLMRAAPVVADEFDRETVRQVLENRKKPGYPGRTYTPDEVRAVMRRAAEERGEDLAAFDDAAGTGAGKSDDD